MSKSNARPASRGKGAKNCPHCGQFLPKKGRHVCSDKKPRVPRSLKTNKISSSSAEDRKNSSAPSLSNATVAFSAAKKRGASHTARIRVPSRVVKRKALHNLMKKYQEMHDEVVYAIRTPNGRAKVEKRFKGIAINWEL